MHPSKNKTEIEQARSLKEGGANFIHKYLYKYGAREASKDYYFRKKISYSPEVAKNEINDVCASIACRLPDVQRLSGSEKYNKWVNSDVTGDGFDMNAFIRCQLLPELLFLGKVGVLVEAPPVAYKPTKADAVNHVPYLVTYKYEDIDNWLYDNKGKLVKLRLLKCTQVLDKHGFPSQYNHVPVVYTKTEMGVTVEEEGRVTTLEGLSEIPFVIVDIGESFSRSIFDPQVALTNLCSSDMGFAIRNNFPLYTEQQDNAARARTLIEKKRAASSEEDAEDDRDEAANARFYGQGMERPAFINPSSETLVASLQFKKEIREDIKQSVQNRVKGLAEDRTIESGLAAIGDVLEAFERRVCAFFEVYTSEEAATVKYPEDYSLRSVKDIREEVDLCLDSAARVPSQMFSKVALRRAAQAIMSNHATAEEIQQVYGEINDAEVTNVDPNVIDKDMKNGLVDAKTASKARGYPERCVGAAKADHIERLKAIQIAQAPGMGAARGLDDLGEGPIDSQAKGEKTVSQTPDGQANKQKAVRGPSDD